MLQGVTSRRKRQLLCLQGWFTPAEAAVQMQQCIVQQVNPFTRSTSTEDKKKKKLTGTSVSTLLQLPGIEEDVLRQLLSNGSKSCIYLIDLLLWICFFRFKL